MNPLKGFMGNQMNNPMNNVLQMMNGGMNPQMIMDRMLQNNPQAKQFLEQMKNQSNGRSPKEMALQYARQQGISDQQLMEMANKMGLK